MQNAQSFPESQRDLVEIIDFGFTLQDVVKRAKSDGGGINLGDWPKLIELFQPGSAAIEGSENVIPDWKSVSPQVHQEVVGYFINKFDLPSDVIERRIEKALVLVVAIYDLVNDADADDTTTNEFRSTGGN